MREKELVREKERDVGRACVLIIVCVCVYQRRAARLLKTSELYRRLLFYKSYRHSTGAFTGCTRMLQALTLLHILQALTVLGEAELSADKCTFEDTFGPGCSLMGSRCHS